MSLTAAFAQVARWHRDMLAALRQYAPIKERLIALGQNIQLQLQALDDQEDGDDEHTRPRDAGGCTGHAPH
jgi:hypothetical protein